MCKGTGEKDIEGMRQGEREGGGEGDGVKGESCARDRREGQGWNEAGFRGRKRERERGERSIEIF